MGTAPGANGSVKATVRRSTMLITPTQVQVTVDRQQDLVAAVLRDRRIAGAIQSSPAATPRSVDHIRGGLRQAVAALLALVAIG